MATVMMKEMPNWRVCNHMRVVSSWSVGLGRQSILGSWRMMRDRKSGGWASKRKRKVRKEGLWVTTSEERVLWGCTEIRLLLMIFTAFHVAESKTSRWIRQWRMQEQFIGQMSSLYNVSCEYIQQNKNSWSK